MDAVVSKRMRNLRVQHGTRQEDLADYLKVERPTISQYESGKRTPDADKLAKIADYYNVSVDYLLGRTDDPTSSVIDPELDLQPIAQDRVEIIQKKLGELSPESLDFLEFQLNRLHELDLELERKKAVRDKQRK